MRLRRRWRGASAPSAGRPSATRSILVDAHRTILDMNATGRVQCRRLLLGPHPYCSASLFSGGVAPAPRRTSCAINFTGRLLRAVAEVPESQVEETQGCHSRSVTPYPVVQYIS